MLAAAILAAPGIPAFAATDKPISVGLHARNQGSSDTALQEHLNGSSSVTFRLRMFKTPEELVDAFKAGEVDIARLGPLLYVKVRAELAVTPIVAENDRATAVLFTKKESAIRATRDIAGKHLALGYDGSLTSHLIPLLLLSKAGIPIGSVSEDPKQLKTAPKGVLISFAGSHDKVIDLVLSGKADVGGIVDNVFERNVGRGLREIDRSESFPGAPFVARPNADPAVVAEFRRLMLAFKAPAGAERFADGLVSVEDKDYNKIRFLCQAVLRQSYLPK
jgi:ABC-type phosphate/phosphonate transport system substrate-binding protein